MAEHSLSRKALSCYCICQHLYHGGYELKVIDFPKMRPQAEKVAQSCR